MGSLAMADGGASGLDYTVLPEISDASYFVEVLRLPSYRTETHYDDELDAKANALGLPLPGPASTGKRNTSSAQSASTIATTFHARTFSTDSNGSASTALTTQSSIFGPPEPEHAPSESNSGRGTKSISFAQYDRYLSQLAPNLDQPKFDKPQPPPDSSTRSLFSVRTRKSLLSVKSGIKNKMRWRKKDAGPYEPLMSCICCREVFEKTASLHNLPCGHTYCAACLKVMVTQATSDESKMPPRCCTQPIPGQTLRLVLQREVQQLFLKSVIQFSTPWESRVFCPNAACGEFIPPRNKVDPKHPFSATCRRCRTKACVMCKHEAHPVGKDCPGDWELEAVLKMGERSGWRRCYKCRNLVELTQGCTHVTCRCKAQFCYICGGVWDPTVGCPNVCSGEEELERRRLEEEERLMKLEEQKALQEALAAAEAAEKVLSEARTKNNPALQDLRSYQEDEQHRFQRFKARAREAMATRHSQQKLKLMEKHAEQEDKMKERHGRTAAHLEDRQVAAEMELRATLDQGERSVRIRLKHMEAYCDGLGRHPCARISRRTVTERDLRELGQQYNLRDGMERLHEAKINVMRDRQARQMEELVSRQEKEMDILLGKRREDIEDLAGQFAHEEDVVTSVFELRQVRLNRRWELAIEVLCKELENREKARFAPISTPSWPSDGGSHEPTLVEEIGE